MWRCTFEISFIFLFSHSIFSEYVDNTISSASVKSIFPVWISKDTDPNSLVCSTLREGSVYPCYLSILICDSEKYCFCSCFYQKVLFILLSPIVYCSDYFAMKMKFKKMLS